MAHGKVPEGSAGGVSVHLSLCKAGCEMAQLARAQFKQKER